MVLEWEERGQIDPDAGESFGTRLIRSSLVGARGGRVEYKSASGCVYVEFSWSEPSASVTSVTERMV